MGNVVVFAIFPIIRKAPGFLELFPGTIKPFPVFLISCLETSSGMVNIPSIVDDDSKSRYMASEAIVIVLEAILAKTSKITYPFDNLSSDEPTE